MFHYNLGSVFTLNSGKDMESRVRGQAFTTVLVFFTVEMLKQRCSILHLVFRLFDCRVFTLWLISTIKADYYQVSVTFAFLANYHIGDHIGSIMELFSFFKFTTYKQIIYKFASEC